MVVDTGLGCPRVALGLNGPSFPYPLKSLSGLGDDSIASIRASVDALNSQIADYASSAHDVSGGLLTRIPGYVDATAHVPDYYTIEIGNYTGTVTGWNITSGISASEWGAQLARNAAQANGIVQSTPEPTPAPISRLPIRTPVPTPVQPISQLQIYQPRAITDARLQIGEPVGVTPTTGPTRVTVPTVSTTPDIAQPYQMSPTERTAYFQSYLAATGKYPDGTIPQVVSTNNGYASAGKTGEVATSPISDLLQGNWIDGIPNWLLIAGAIGIFVFTRKGK